MEVFVLQYEYVNLYIFGIILGAIYSLFISTILISMILNTGLYARRSRGKILWVILTIVASAYTFYYYNFLFEAIRTNSYEFISKYTDKLLPPALLLMTSFIFLQFRHLLKFRK